MRHAQWYYILGWSTVLVLHNWPVIVALIGAIYSAISVWRVPNRRRIALLYGFILSAIAYEYNKHVGPRLQDAADYLLMFELLPFNRPLWLIVGPGTTGAILTAAIAFLSYGIAGGRLGRAGRPSSGAATRGR